MITRLPPASTDLLVTDRGRGFLSRPWYDYFLSLQQQIAALSGGGGSPGEFTFTQSDVVLGRSSPGGGEGEELTFTDQAQQLADDTTFAEMRNTLEIDAANTPYTPGVPGDWETAPNDVAEALDLLAAGGSSAPPTPTLVAAAETVTIRANSQMLFCVVPTIDGELAIDGTYCEVN